MHNVAYETKRTQLRQAFKALRCAETALKDTAPNLREYRTHEEYRQAREAHDARLQTIARNMADMVAIMKTLDAEKTC